MAMFDLSFRYYISRANVLLVHASHQYWRMSIGCASHSVSFDYIAQHTHFVEGFPAE